MMITCRRQWQFYKSTSHKRWQHLPAYLGVQKVAEHLKPNVRLMIVRWHGAQEGDVNVLVGKGCIARGNANDGYRIEAAGVAHSCRRQIA